MIDTRKWLLSKMLPKILRRPCNNRGRPGSTDPPRCPTDRVEFFIGRRDRGHRGVRARRAAAAQRGPRGGRANDAGERLSDSPKIRAQPLSACSAAERCRLTARGYRDPAVSWARRSARTSLT
jgi:hypothetical protein